jgi:hypothetical protein
MKDLNWQDATAGEARRCSRLENTRDAMTTGNMSYSLETTRPPDVPPAAELGWHFARSDRRLGYGDGRTIREGDTLSVDCRPALCESGLHWSRDLLDALHYARGATLCRIYGWGDTVSDVDKCCGTHRHTVWLVDAEPALRAFARWAALQVAHLWSPPGVVIEYLCTGNARAAAEAAAWAAAGAVAWDAAGEAAWVAAWDAVRAAAWEVARVAAGEAARAAAWEAAGAAQNRQLAQMADEARGGRTEWILALPPSA